MYPKIKNGDIVLLKEISKDLIMFGEIYLVITNDYRVLKYVRKHTSPDKVILFAENDRFDPVEIGKDDIMKLFLYKGKFEKSQI
jgi:SOS-response transcriptional repressor LexA